MVRLKKYVYLNPALNKFSIGGGMMAGYTTFRVLSGKKDEIWRLATPKGFKVKKSIHRRLFVPE